MEESEGSRRKRKEEGKRLKRQRIQESGGVRPRKQQQEAHDDNAEKDSPAAPNNPKTKNKPLRNNGRKIESNPKKRKHPQHRFGRVMEQVPIRGQPRIATVSIAVPGSIVANCQTRELKTQITGQIARAATIYHVDEIVVFDDHLSDRKAGGSNNYRGGGSNNRDDRRSTNVDDNNKPTAEGAPASSKDPHAFMARILQYAECPQYLRRHFFPMHHDLQFAGLLAPVDAPHHVRAEDRCSFREGVVLDKAHSGNGSLVNCGIRGRPVHIDQKLQPGIRCTVQLDPASYGNPGPIHGKVVSPNSATRENGTYWGYTVRMANSIKAVFDECPYGEYDLTIGTSERGNESVEDANFSLLRKKNHNSSQCDESSSNQHYEHALIVFGGVAGIEECVDADESLKLSGSNSHELFDKWINVCPFQGSRTIRSEEAVLITLAKLSPYLVEAAMPMSSDDSKKKERKSKETTAVAVAAVKLSEDESLSEESSDESGDDDGEE